MEALSTLAREGGGGGSNANERKSVVLSSSLLHSWLIVRRQKKYFKIVTGIQDLVQIISKSSWQCHFDNAVDNIDKYYLCKLFK